MGETLSTETATVEQLQARVRELEQERRHLLAIVEILQETSGTLHFIDVLQGITRKLGETFGLDRCSILLVERGTNAARLVASYEDPAVRSYLVDLDRYPELRRALRSGEAVFIPDAQRDPELKHARDLLKNRRVKSITVVPITWRGSVIGVIFLRTFRDGPAFSESDVRFTQVVAGIAAKALRNAYRYERLLKTQSGGGDGPRRDDLKRIALIALLRRLLDGFEQREVAWSEDLLSRTSEGELDRLVDVALTVLEEEARAR
jgi:GAF domain-containing protein